MIAASKPSSLESTRREIVGRIRGVRTSLGWSQAELAEQLGISQARLSVIERGGGTISAEQFVHLLSITNLPIEHFLPPQNPEDEIQNALVRLGAYHLHAAPGVLPSQRLSDLSAVIRESLIQPRSHRLLTALAPVLVRNAESLNLHYLQGELSRLGLSGRLPWLLENVLAAIDLTPAPTTRLWKAALRQSRAIFTDFLARVAPASDGTPPDRLDPDLRSAAALAELVASASAISRRWNVLAAAQPEDFAEPLADVVASG